MTLTRLDLPRPAIHSDRVVAHVLYSDGFGNVALDLRDGDLPKTFLQQGRRVRVEAVGAGVSVPFARTFSDVGEGEGVLYQDSAGALALAINCGSAAEALGLGPDDEVSLSPAS